MKLIIAEKPAQARDYAEALGGFQRKDGYLESKDFYITWCFGHLIELEKDSVYREGTTWDLSYLPLIPETFRYTIGKDQKGKVDPGKKKQLNTIKDLAKKSTEIINATDADREGETIFLYVYNFLNLKLPFRRLWISSLTKGDIIKGFSNLLSAKEVSNLGKAGYARAISDWLVGINGTQAATLKLGNRNLLTIGRVQTAILKIICERYLKHLNFKPSFSYRIVTEHQFEQQSFDSATNIFERKEEAENFFQYLKPSHIFKEKIEAYKNVYPPLLHSIDTLIVEANNIFSYSGQQTLNAAQSLYEKKLTTYPRTDSNYINDENYSNLKSYLSSLAREILDLNFTFSQDKPKSVNASKLTGSHDAIIPTGEIKGYNTLSIVEKNVYKLIIHKCLESFSIKAIYKKGKYIFENNEIEFYTYTSVLVEIGWKFFSFHPEIEDEENGFNLDLSYIPGESVKIEAKELVEIKSQPPKLYTDANLIPDLTNIGKFLKEENSELLLLLKGQIDLNEVQIGTQATRPIIIERLKKLEFISIEKKKYIPTEKGLAYYNTIKDLKVSNIANTAILEKELKDIADGKLNDNIFYSNLNNYIKGIVSDILNIECKLELNKKATFGFCPKCKTGRIIEGLKGFGCDQYKSGCDFVIWKVTAGKKLSEKNISDLLNSKETSMIKGLTSLKGSTFDAKLYLDEDFRVKFKFE